MDDQSYYEEYYYDESEDDGDDYSRKPVPILLSIILVVTYIIGGAFLFQMWEGWSFLDRFPKLSTLATTCLASDPVQFLLDCSTMGPVITSVQRGGEGLLNPLFKVTRNYCHALHNARMSLLASD